jgi:hypothetical protein
MDRELYCAAGQRGYVPEGRFSKEIVEWID